MLGEIFGSTIQGVFNAIEAQKNRNFQERMANTAIQRQINDARAAGISPAMLFGHSASGASTPQGNAANISNPNINFDKILGMIQKDRYYDHIEKMQDRELDYYEDNQNKNYTNYYEKNKEANDSIWYLN